MEMAIIEVTCVYTNGKMISLPGPSSEMILTVKHPAILLENPFLYLPTGQQLLSVHLLMTAMALEAVRCAYTNGTKVSPLGRGMEMEVLSAMVKLLSINLDIQLHCLQTGWHLQSERLLIVVLAMTAVAMSKCILSMNDMIILISYAGASNCRTIMNVSRVIKIGKRMLKSRNWLCKIPIFQKEREIFEESER